MRKIKACNEEVSAGNVKVVWCEKRWFLYHYNLNTFTSLEFSNFTIVDQIYVEDPERTSSNIVNDISNSKSKT